MGQRGCEIHFMNYIACYRAIFLMLRHKAINADGQYFHRKQCDGMFLHSVLRLSDNHTHGDVEDARGDFDDVAGDFEYASSMVITIRGDGQLL